MWQIFAIDISDSARCEGEMHLHEAPDSCSSIFQSPNATFLRGIAPHVHDDCDDIEILLKGSIVLPSSPSRGYCVSAPALIINRAGETHGFVAGTDGAAVLGIRCPKSYRGRSAVSDEIVSWRGRVIALGISQTREYTTENCTIRVHLFNEHFSFDVARHPGAEYVGVLICEQGLLYFSDGTTHEISGATLVFSNDDSLTRVQSVLSGRLIEVLPRQNGGYLV